MGTNLFDFADLIGGEAEVITAMFALTGTWFMLILPLVILQLVLTIAAAWNLMKKPVPANDKIPWLLLIVLVNLIGPIVYFAIGSGKLDDKAARYEDEREHGR